MTFTFEEFCKRMQAEIFKYLPKEYTDSSRGKACGFRLSI